MVKNMRLRLDNRPMHVLFVDVVALFNIYLRADGLEY